MCSATDDPTMHDRASAEGLREALDEHVKHHDHHPCCVEDIFAEEWPEGYVHVDCARASIPRTETPE